MVVVAVLVVSSVVSAALRGAPVARTAATANTERRSLALRGIVPIVFIVRIVSILVSGRPIAPYRKMASIGNFPITLWTAKSFKRHPVAYTMRRFGIDRKY